MLKNFCDIKNTYDIIIIGCGLSGAVLAERYANALNKKVLIVEKRDHIGGNCYDYVDEETGIRVSKYGAHLFHTNNKEIWKYVQKFSEWILWEHKVLGKIGNKFVSIPVNIHTVNELFDLQIQTEEEMKKWLDSVQIKNDNPQNGKEAALNRVGEELYNLIFKHYTKKQWNKYPEELDPSVLQRIPVRINFNDRYFTDQYQALPKEGYTKMFENMLNHPNITICLNTDFFKIKDDENFKRNIQYEKIFFTGPVDLFYAQSRLDKLEYRSIKFVHERIMYCKKAIGSEHFQLNSVVNYPGENVSFTRIVEHKHFLNQQSDHTIITREYTTDEGDPYYPVPTKENQELYSKYKQIAEQEKNIYFVGRLANYKYLNMDEAVDNALELFYKLEFSKNKHNLSNV